MSKLVSVLSCLLCVLSLSSCTVSGPITPDLNIAIYDPDIPLENSQRTLDPEAVRETAHYTAQVEHVRQEEIAATDVLVTPFDSVAISETIKNQKRVALVVGNADYQYLTPLRNPVNDAQALARILKERNFEVVLATNQSKSDLDQVVRQFSDKARGADLALYFYSGHGMQMEGSNWMLPVDAREIADKADMNIQANSMNVVFDQLMTRANTSVILLDACRDNPFVDQLARSENRTSGTKNLSLGRKGLARIESFSGDAYVAFATAPGKLAYDGRGRYSPFTEALLRHLDEPVVELESLMRNVRKDVKSATANEAVPQVPWGNSALTQVVYL